MNRVVLIGRLTKDPELNFAPGTGNAVANFTIAVDRRFASRDGKREADFIPVVVWGKQGESVANYTSKGKLIGVSGRIQTRSYDAQDGSRRYITEIIADEVQFLEWGGNDRGAQSQQGGFNNNMSGGFNQAPAQSEPSFGDNLTEMDDDEVPF